MFLNLEDWRWFEPRRAIKPKFAVLSFGDNTQEKENCLRYEGTDERKLKNVENVRKRSFLCLLPIGPLVK